MGRVTSPEGVPLAGARVSVTSAETQITRTKVTGADGRAALAMARAAIQACQSGRAVRMDVVDPTRQVT